MTTIIAGSRSITDPWVLDAAIKDCPWVITRVVCGMAGGVDSLGKLWANYHNIPVNEFPAKWGDLNVVGAVIRYRNGRAYNAKAGHIRNVEMAEHAQALLAIWDGVSAGTRDMIKIAKAKGLLVHVVK